MSSTTGIVAINTGSSSLKVVVRDLEERLRVRVDRFGDPSERLEVDGHQPAGMKSPVSLDEAISEVGDLCASRSILLGAVVHRVVHGGENFVDPVVIDDALLAKLSELIPLAPLHLPAGIEAITAARKIWPDVPQIACFDTAFHEGMPGESSRLAVPAELAVLGVRRYGFHGLSIQSVVDRLPKLQGAVIAHLGSGCSVTAVAHGMSRYTTMSVTPTSGIVSATRSGDLDPEAVLYLLESRGYDIATLRDLLTHKSGLAGITGGPHDVRDLLANRSDSRVDLALRVFVQSVAMAVAGCATTLDRWDNLIFTGGVGEHAVPLREEICRHLLALRGSAQGSGIPSQRLTASGVNVRVIASDEEAVMDRQARELLAGERYPR